MSNEAIVLGGSFDPPHNAHLLLGSVGLDLLPDARLIVVPTFKHAFAKELSPFELRCEMTRGAFAALERASVSEIERELGGVSFTYDTVLALRARGAAKNFRLLIGVDVANQFSRFHRAEELAELAPPLVIARVGETNTSPFEAHAVHLPNLSSTEVRRRVANGESISDLVSPSVRELIQEHGLYRSQP